MALPALLNIASYENTSVSASPYNVGSYTANAGSNRKVIWFESTEVASAAGGATAVTWGGVSMTKAGEAIQTGNCARIWTINEADFPSGATGDLVATITDISDNAHIKSRAGTLTNVIQQAPEASNTSAQTTDPVVTSITPVTSDAYLLDCASCGNSGVSITVTEGPDQVADVADSASGGRGMGIGISHRLAASTDPVNMGWNHSAAPNRWAHVVLAYARIQDAAANPKGPLGMPLMGPLQRVVGP